LLVAPGEKAFDNELGIAKIGIATGEMKNVTTEKVLIATASFKIKTENTTAIDFFDVRDGGNTYITARSSDGSLKNMLAPIKQPALLFTQK